jgi:septin family protein
MVMLMGSTGSGKSYFINQLKKGATVESDSLYSCESFMTQYLYTKSSFKSIGTASCQIVQTKIGRTNLAVVDCPGFNDTKRSDTEVLGEIAKVLSSQYLFSNKLRLRGILYLRDISKTRMEGSDVKSFQLFQKLVGKEAFPHVRLVTTMWGNLDSEGKNVAFKREKELEDGFWNEMMQEGSHMTRFEGNKASAEGIISQLVGDANPVILQIQHELIDNELKLAATAAGSVLAPIVEEKLGESKSKIQRFRARLARESNSTVQKKVLLDIKKAEKERDQAQSDKDQLEQKVGADLKGKIAEGSTWQETLRTICSVLGVGISVVASVILPAAGSSCTIM